ncbi:MAG: peptidase C13 family protein, partial [Candidatus Accumulibacter sp.]|nr:peptidase C13 family protein [Accumulibacter sp.]
FTDFGRAYFHEALRETRSFTEAFRLTAGRVAQSEEQQGRTPSRPQMARGKNYREMFAAEQEK